ncbi:MAG: hypothetical protein H6818_21485 [Phycisphaerales bacterium]|nr:hypothetical protein [Phycisphaerales bacterium]MCB9862364.1 hypothetical protein [Phycisphaerales bacterium]
MAPDAKLCIHCGLDIVNGKRAATTVSYAPASRKRHGPSVVREFGYFGIGYGLILIIFGIVGMSGTAAARGGSISGVVMLISAVAMIIPGLMNIAGGVLAFVKPSKWSILLCLIGSLALPLLYFGLPLLMGTAPGFNCMTILLIVIPLTVVSRATRAMDELK